MAKLRLRDLVVRDFMSREVVTGTPDEPISEILGKMRSHDIHEVPILEKEKLAGIVSMAAIARRRELAPTAKASTLVHTAPEISPDVDLPAAAEKFLSSGHRSLPVTEKGKLVGILSRGDVVRALAGCEDVQALTVGQVMTPQPQCVSAKDTIAQARTTMASLGERAVPVVDDKRRLVGVVGLKDLAELFARPKAKAHKGGIAGEKEAMKVRVSSIMRTPVTVRPDTPLPKALALMSKERISTIIAEAEGEPVGIVTTADLMELAAQFQEREGVLVQISGLEEQPDVYEQIYGVIQKAMRRIGEIVTPRLLNLHIVQYKAEGDKSKWSIRARFATEHGMYHFKHFDWDLFKTLEGLLDQIEAHIKKEKDRRIAERRPHRGS
jgi:CBS domain-containing protein